MKRQILLYSFLFALLLVYSRAVFEVTPFGAGLYLALIFLDFNSLALSPMLIVSEYLFNFAPSSLISSSVCALVCTVYSLFFRHNKRVFPLFGAASLIGYGINALRSGSAVTVALTLFLIPLFAFVCYVFINPLQNHRLKYKLLDTEIVCGAAMLVVAGLGLSATAVGQFSPFWLVAVFAVCVAGKSVSNTVALVSAVCLGLGASLYYNSPFFLAASCVVSATAILFLPAPRALVAPAVCSTFVAFCFYFGVETQGTLYALASVFVGGVAYAVLPKKFIATVSAFFGAPKSRTALRYMVNKNRRDTGNELVRVSEIFWEMGESMVQTTVTPKKLSLLKDAVTARVCEHCVNRDKCAEQGVFQEISALIECSINSDRANILNASPLLSENCVNIVALIDCVNDLLIKYEGLKRKSDTTNAAKVVVASQLKGVSDILKSMSLKQSTPINYAEEHEKRIMDDLTYRGVIAGEVWVKEDGELIIVALKSTLKEQIVKKSLRALFKKEFFIKIEDSALTGWAVVTAQPTPVYDVVFGSCNNCKNEQGCGDTHSFMKLTDGRFMAALCDGMGCGARAREFSSRVLSLIENFYRVGFDHSFVLDSVNKFLSLSGEETFGAMDIVVVDLNSLVTDIIKISSPATYIKNTEKLLKIEGNCLPIGVLDEMKPAVKTMSLKPGDTVVMTSDGVSDCFDGDDMAGVINSASGLPKELASSLINTAINQRCARSDDMTVIAFRIFKREL
ncbi:MAG: SpoIIE family protein phosphatase [Clostridia bacterium]|nr:SpoIIE family protein phosphatase [Clostridia bacterium]